MRKIIASVLLIVMLSGFAGCNKKTGFKVGNEDNALCVYNCPSDNLFGLEKVVIFDDSAVAVFDKKVCDRKNNLQYIDKYIDEEEYHYGFSVTVDNYYTGMLVFESADSNRIFKSNVRITDGRYVVTESFTDDEQRKIDPEKEFKITGLNVAQRSIAINDGSFELSYTEINDSGKKREITQSYDAAKGKWGKEIKGEFSSSETDIVKSYFLRLPAYDEKYDEYSCEKDGVKYTLTNFGDYFELEIINRSEETRTIGGDYKLQKLDNGVFRDLPTVENNGFYNSFPRVVLYDVKYDSEKTEISLGSYNDTFDIEPFQKINANLLSLPYNLLASGEYAGEYRLIYGDAVIDFNIELDYAW
ncbi:MAG: hypothetical protein IKG30_07050 [Clostridiales bacterium]|nr:hypothetical protein [Clostridiales bacterium]